MAKKLSLWTLDLFNLRSAIFVFSGLKYMSSIRVGLEKMFLDAGISVTIKKLNSTELYITSYEILTVDLVKSLIPEYESFGAESGDSVRFSFTAIPNGAERGRFEGFWMEHKGLGRWRETAAPSEDIIAEDLSPWIRELFGLDTRYLIELGNMNETEQPAFIEALKNIFQEYGGNMQITTKTRFSLYIKVDTIIDSEKFYDNLPPYIPARITGNYPKKLDTSVQFTRLDSMKQEHERFTVRWQIDNGIRQMHEHTIEEALSPWTQMLFGLTTTFKVLYVEPHADQFGCSFDDIRNWIKNELKSKGKNVLCSNYWKQTVVDNAFNIIIEGHYSLDELGKIFDRKRKDGKLLGITLYKYEGFPVLINKDDGSTSLVYYFNKDLGLFKKGI